MALEKIQTYFLLDTWAKAPPAEGWAYVVRRFQMQGSVYTAEQIKREVWWRLVEIGLLDQHKKNTPRDWKRAKRIWQTEYKGSTMR